MRYLLSGWLILNLLTSCGQQSPDSTSSAGSNSAEQTCITFDTGTRLARLSTHHNRMILSYIQSSPDTMASLYMQEWQEDEPSEPTWLASGNNWFLNWADFPSVVPIGDSSHYFYHYLRNSGLGTFDYDIIYGFGDTQHPRSLTSHILHQDLIPAEHGFVSTAPLNGNSIQVSWLDGRNTKGGNGHHGSHGHGHTGAMTLRTTTLSVGIKHQDRVSSIELDERVCDCCQTSTTSTRGQIMVAYRDRTQDEVRDISYTVRDNTGKWHTPRPVHNDHWQISGCPVNGPVLASNPRGNIAIAWFTAANNTPAIKFARYDSASDTFFTPIILDDNHPIGRLNMVMDEDGMATVIGLTQSQQENQALLTQWQIDRDNKVTSQTLDEVPASRSSGFPTMARHNNRLYWAYTLPSCNEDDNPCVKLCFH